MSDLFLDLFNRSVSAAWVVLAVLAARLLLKKAPKSIHCLLWAMVGLRLICFWDLPARFSLIPSAEVITPESLFDRAPVITSGVPIIDNVVNPVYTESFRTDGLSSVNPLQIWVALWANIWLLVMMGFWIWSIVTWIRVKRQVRASVKLRDNIFLCDDIGTPFILGMVFPKIYLPSSLADEQKTHVIAHERAHLKRLDHWWKPLAWLLLTVHWFNPLLWVAYILLCRDIELACDERVIGGLSLEEKKGYSAALLECSVRRSMIAACPLAFGEVGVKARVSSVLSYKKPAIWIILAALVVLAALAAGFLTDPPGAPAEVRWRDTLYVQAGQTDFLPDKIESQGMLTSVLHDSTPHPTKDGQAIGLGWEYAGQPLYQVGNALYLEEPGGGRWMKFVGQPAYTAKTFEVDGISFQLDLPYGWEAETISGTGYLGLRFRDEAVRDGWITIKYWPNRELEYTYAGIAVETRFPSGMVGTVYYLDDMDFENKIWSMVYFFGLDAYMSVERPENFLWTQEYHRQTLDVIGSMAVTKDGRLLFTGSKLGISLAVEDPTPTGATLVCTQDGTLWNHILTGREYVVARWDEATQEWDYLEDKPNTAWTTEAYTVPLNETTRQTIDWEWIYDSLEPGVYRLYKHYTGERGFLADREKVDETCYAEFIIE